MIDRMLDSYVEISSRIVDSKIGMSTQKEKEDKYQ